MVYFENNGLRIDQLYLDKRRPLVSFMRNSVQLYTFDSLDIHPVHSSLPEQRYFDSSKNLIVHILRNIRSDSLDLLDTNCLHLTEHFEPEYSMILHSLYLQNYYFDSFCLSRVTYL